MTGRALHLVEQPRRFRFLMSDGRTVDVLAGRDAPAPVTDLLVAYLGEGLTVVGYVELEADA